MWGSAIYFAVKASYSCGGYAFKKFDGTKQVFLAEVLIGDCIKSHPNKELKEPPKKMNGDPYDSVSGNTQGSDVYMVYAN